MNAMPRITFGVIVLNGQPFTPYTLRSVYPFAHQIVVAEGAVLAANAIATSDGHSRDGTLDELQRFKAEEDPDDKLVIVTAEDEGHPDGFWPGEKDEQSRAYAKRATGDYLWQLDIDEFYRAEDMERVLAMLQADPSIAAVTFKQLTFWGGTDYIVDGWYLRRGATYYHRLFRWGPGYSYATHRPPTVLDREGVDLRSRHWVRGDTLAARGIFLYHYSLLFPKQVLDKCDYYANAAWAQRAGAAGWAQDGYMNLRRPFRVHNVYAYPSWLARYTGPHPDETQRMVADIQGGAVVGALRQTDDIEALVDAWWYRLGRSALKAAEPVDRWSRSGLRKARGGVRRLLKASAR